MLVITRKPNESFIIDGELKITVTEINNKTQAVIEIEAYEDVFLKYPSTPEHFNKKFHIEIRRGGL